jgi:hypothetical protein
LKLSQHQSQVVVSKPALLFSVTYFDIMDQSKQQYWLPGFGLSRHVVLSQIHCFLGPTASVRPFTYQVCGWGVASLGALRRIEKVTFCPDFQPLCLGSGRIFDHGKPSHTGKPAGPLSLSGDGLLLPPPAQLLCFTARYTAATTVARVESPAFMKCLQPCPNILFSVWPRSKSRTFRICLGNTSAKPH